MPKYLLEVNYSVDGVKGVLAKGGSARRAAGTRRPRKSVGGKIESFFFALGSTDRVRHRRLSG